jgi:CelD/BcsL family acetyltransferase involved in cellulose biosynthesis
LAPHAPKKLLHSRMTEIEIIGGSDAIARLGPLWAEVASHGRLGAFETFDLVQPAASLAQQHGSEPLVVMVRENGRPVSLLPLRRERLLGARTAVPLLQPLAQYADVVGKALDAACFAPMCAQLTKSGFDLILLRKVRADSGLHPLLDGHALSQRATERALYIDLRSYESFATFDASFSSTTRRNRRQRRKRLESEAGPLSFDVLRGNNAVAAFDTAIAWKRRWLADRGISSPVFDRGPWETLLRGAVSSGAAIVSRLSAGSTPVAMEVGFAEGATYISYLGAFDARFGAYSPGQEQMLRTVAWCFEQGLERYDLLAPADDYKRQWVRKDTGVALDDYAIALTQVGRGVAEVRRHVRPLARDIYLKLTPEIRVAGGRYGVPAAAAAAAAVCASMVIATLE